MSLKEPSLKMSKSHEDPRSRILLTDSPGDIRKKIKGALTDSISGVSYAPLERPGVSNLLEIMACLESDNTSCSTLASRYNAMSLSNFKDLAADKIIGHLSQIRANYNRVITDDRGKNLRAIANSGAVEARKIAQLTMGRVRNAVGLQPEYP